MARFQRGNGGRSALALAGSGSVRAGIRGCPALRLGLRVDGTRHANPLVIAAVAAVAFAVHLFVVFYEEPTLHAKFGPEYEEYRQNVGRWWPRLRGWDKPL
jgi:hypothetical protein